MPRKCTVCTHTELEAINAALVNNEAYRGISRTFFVSEDALMRHKNGHLPEHLSQAAQAEQVTHADDLLAQVRDLQTKALAILAKAEKAGELRTALIANRTARENIELMASLLGKLQQTPSVNIVMTPEWIQLRTVILQTLAPFPEARVKLAEVLSAGAR